jgi:hypothetical protein
MKIKIVTKIKIKSKSLVAKKNTNKINYGVIKNYYSVVEEVIL